MCYVCTSHDGTLSFPCPMCKVFKPSGKCPHIRDVCRNRTNHPRFDVLFLTNAEVQCFNGCGYCKWSSTNPPSPNSGYYNNPGWPGCCRPPSGVHEYKMIQPADWHAVTAVHHVPIPHEIKAALDLFAPRPSNAVSAQIRRPGTPPRRPGTPPRRPSTPPVRGNSGSRPSPTLPPKTFIAPATTRNRYPPPMSPSNSGSGHSSPNSANKPLDERKKPSSARPSPPASTSNLGPTRPSNLTAPLKPSSSVNRATAPASTSTKSIKKPQLISSASSSSSSSSEGSESDSLGSLTDGTVTSDGAFTDYLSEESEAELQRQAEAKAAVVAQNEMEELEFKAARMKLAHVDLRPPRAWNGSSATRTAANTTRYTARG